MKTKRGKKWFLVLLFPVALLIVLSCQGKKQIPVSKQHQANIVTPEGEKIYADHVSNSKIIREDIAAKSRTRFVCYKIGLEDSTQNVDSKLKLKKGKYIQYDMSKDWKLMMQGDSLPPVFSQPVVKRSENLDETILVFEIPSGAEPDTLVFQNSFNGSVKQVLALTEHK